MKVKRIKVHNVKAIIDQEINLNGATVILMGGNNKGKSTLLRALKDRLLKMKADHLVRSGEESGEYLMEFTDASVNQDNHDAGFAYWISCYQFEIQSTGYAGKHKKSEQAEVYAIHNAIQYLLQKELVPVDRVIIYTDSIPAIHCFSRSREKAFYTLVDFALKNGMRPQQVFDLFWLVHVKAHTKEEDDKSYKNRWCDMMAKQHRLSKREFNATIFDISDILI